MKQLKELTTLNSQKLTVFVQVASNGKMWTMMTVMAILARIVLNGDPGGAWGG